MDYQQRQALPTGLRKFSLRSLSFGGLFIIALLVATCIDLTGVLEYCKVIGAPSSSTLELGAILTVASIAPFLAMGFSVSADLERNK
jgi:hypothetical protein